MQKKCFSSKKSILFLLMVLSVSAMLMVQSNILVLLTAVFTFSYFAFWLKDNIKAFSKWIRENKKHFAIFGEYANRFVEFFMMRQGRQKVKK